MRSVHSPRRFSDVAFFNGSDFCLICLSPSVGDHRALPSVLASLLQEIDGVMLLALCTQVVSQTPQHFKVSEVQATDDGRLALLLANLSARSFTLIRACEGQYIHRSL